MKFFKLDLLTLLISLFLFSSCKDSSNVGLDIDPNNAVSGTLLDTVTVTSNTMLDEATQTYYGPSSAANPDKYPLGTMKDDIFGTTTASLAMAVNIAGTSSFRTLTTIDSAVLVLAFDTDSLVARSRAFYGDSTATYNINVSQLSAPVATQTSWLSNKVYASGDVLGTYTGIVRPNTPLRVTQTITGAADTLVRVAPQLRIKLNSAMIKSKLLDLDSATLISNPKLNLAFRGLKVSANASGKGGMMFFKFAASSSSIKVYYKQTNATTPANIDTLTASFPINTQTNAVAATVSHDYTNTPVAAQLATPGVYQTTYLQAMSGLRTKIGFPGLKNLRTSLGSKIVINKAELVVDSSDPADSIPFKIPPVLALYRIDIAGQRQLLPDGNHYSVSNPSGDIRAASSGLAIGGYYRYVQQGYIHNSYAFNITNYIQDIVDGKTVDYGTFLAPISIDAIPTVLGRPVDATGAALNLASYAYPAPTSAGRVVIGSFANPTRKIRLNIYYVKTSTQ